MGAPTDGSAWRRGDCDHRVMRGGSWTDGPGNLRSDSRAWVAAANRSNSIGFRVVQDP